MGYMPSLVDRVPREASPDDVPNATAVDFRQSKRCHVPSSLGVLPILSGRAWVAQLVSSESREGIHSLRRRGKLRRPSKPSLLRVEALLEVREYLLSEGLDVNITLRRGLLVAQHAEVRVSEVRETHYRRLSQYFDDLFPRRDAALRIPLPAFYCSVNKVQGI